MNNIIGYTGGVFDLFHVGHVNLLNRAADKCDYLIVGVSTDELCFSYKHKTPTIPFKDRLKIVKNIKVVDKVVCQDTLDHTINWEKYRFHKLFVGTDWKGSERWTKWEQLLRAKGVEIIYLPYTQHVSSTKIKELLCNE